MSKRIRSPMSVLSLLLLVFIAACCSQRPDVKQDASIGNRLQVYMMLDAIGGYIDLYRQQGRNYDSWTEVTEHIRCVQFGKDILAPNPFHTTSKAEQAVRLGRTRNLPSGIDPSALPLLWDLETFPSGYLLHGRQDVGNKMAVLFWNGSTRFLSPDQLTSAFRDLNQQNRDRRPEILDRWDNQGRPLWRTPQGEEANGARE